MEVPANIALCPECAGCLVLDVSNTKNIDLDDISDGITCLADESGDTHRQHNYWQNTGWEEVFSKVQAWILAENILNVE